MENKITSHKTRLITLGSLKELRTLLPIFLIAVFLSVLIEYYLPEAVFNSVLGENLIIVLPVATILGIIFPIPRYATYPIAFALMLKGAGYGVAFALISGEVIGESVVRDIVEIKYFGKRFFIWRFLISAILIICGAFLVEAIL